MTKELSTAIIEKIFCYFL